MRIGYGRCSSRDQSLDIQIEELQKAGCERIFAEKQSGTKLEGRVQLEALLVMLRAGDQVCATRLDRLARSVPDFFKIAKTIEERGATLHFTQQAIETASPAGRMLAGMLAIFAQFETELRRDRQREGIAHARASFKYEGHGRKPSYDRAVIEHMFFNQKKKPSEIAKHLGCVQWTVRRALKEIKAERDANENGRTLPTP